MNLILHEADERRYHKSDAAIVLGIEIRSELVDQRFAEPGRQHDQRRQT